MADEFRPDFPYLKMALVFLSSLCAGLTLTDVFIPPVKIPIAAFGGACGALYFYLVKAPIPPDTQNN